MEILSMAISKRLTRKAFDQAVKRTTIQPRGIEIAKAVLVHAESQRDVAERYGLSQPGVSRYVSIVWSAHVQAEALPPGLEEVTVVLPPDKVAIVRTWESEERIKRLKQTLGNK